MLVEELYKLDNESYEEMLPEELYKLDDESYKVVLDEESYELDNELTVTTKQINLDSTNNFNLELGREDNEASTFKTIIINEV